MATANGRRLGVALALILGFMAVEVVVGILASSLALLSDAAHMLTDAGAIALALVAARLAGRPAQGGFTFGLKRAEILSAQINGVTLVALAAVIVFEGIRRLIVAPGRRRHRRARGGRGGHRREPRGDHGPGRRRPPQPQRRGRLPARADRPVRLHRHGGGRRGHPGSPASGQADGIAALLVAALMLRSGWGLLRESGRVLLEAAPRGLDPQEIGRTLAAEPHVVEVHDLHVWEVTSGMPSLSAHVTVGAGCDTQSHRRRLAELLHERFGIDHTTLQVEARHEGPLEIEPLRPGRV